MNILITGGAGFIGSHLTERLINEGNYVTVADNLISGSIKNIEKFKNNSSFKFLNQDVTLKFYYDEDIDQIYHLASPASPNHHSKISYHALALETIKVNTDGTMNMLELAKEKNAKFLFTSTSEIYGDPKESPQKEDYKGNVSTTGPRSVYDEAKRLGETITAYFWREKHVNARIARIFNTYGPNMLAEDKRMIVNFILQALSEKTITIYGNGSQTRSLCYVEDTVDGLVRLMNSNGTNKEIINIGNTKEYTVKEYAEMIKNLTGSSSEIKCTEDLPKDDPLQRKPNIEKAKQILDWEPKTELEVGLKKTIEYFKKETT